MLVLTDLPVAAVRYAALLNTAMRRNHSEAVRMVDWAHHGLGIYEQVGFDYLPWLVREPHERAIYALPDLHSRMAELRRQEFRSDFGVADDISQVLDHYPDLVTSEERYLVSFVTRTREGSPGWRWYKHGPYIGTRTPRCEHLGDEPEIDQVVTWAIWQVLPEVDDLTQHLRPELADWLVARMAGRVTSTAPVLP